MLEWLKEHQRELRASLEFGEFFICALSANATLLMRRSSSWVPWKELQLVSACDLEHRPRKKRRWKESARRAERASHVSPASSPIDGCWLRSPKTTHLSWLASKSWMWLSANKNKHIRFFWGCLWCHRRLCLFTMPKESLYTIGCPFVQPTSINRSKCLRRQVDGRNPFRTTKESLVSADSPVNTNKRYMVSPNSHGFISWCDFWISRHHPESGSTLDATCGVFS